LLLAVFVYQIVLLTKDGQTVGKRHGEYVS